MVDVGDRIGDYEIAAKLKSGGMAALYLARRAGAAGFSRHVAVKVVHPHLAEDETFTKMFVDEALLSAKIQHPGVVHVEELGQHEGTYFLVMEYVNGCSLSQLMRELRKRKRRLTADVATYVGIQVADALHAAHETTDDRGQRLGVVHRDVSPQNVLLAYKGHVKLIDFGIAKARGRSQATATGALKGKFRYMAPEQARGLEVDRRTDIYALGILLWEMLTCRRLFDGENDLVVLDKVRNPEVEPPGQYVPGVSEALDAVILKALAPDPNDRFSSAKEMRRALAEALPQALTMDSESLSELLLALMDRRIREEQKALPSSVSAVVHEPELAQATDQAQSDAQSSQKSGGAVDENEELDIDVEQAEASEEAEEHEALKTMTLSAEDLALLDEGEGGQGASGDSGSHRSGSGSNSSSSQPSSSQPSSVEISENMAAAGASRRDGSSTGVAEQTGAIPGLRGRTWAAVAGAAVLIGGVVAMTVGLQADEDKTPSATPPAAAPPDTTGSEQAAANDSTGATTDASAAHASATGPESDAGSASAETTDAGTETVAAADDKAADEQAADASTRPVDEADKAKAAQQRREAQERRKARAERRRKRREQRARRRARERRQREAQDGQEKNDDGVTTVDDIPLVQDTF